MSRLTFQSRSQSMGLRDIGNECFQYDDSIGSVIYKHLQTKDLVDIPLYAIFTKPPVENTEFSYAGFVSDLYQFEGNEVMNEKIRQSISEIGTPIFREYISLNYPQRTRMSNEILIQNSTNVPRIGDIFPQIIVKNTYDGSGAREYTFGFSILEDSTTRLMGIGLRNKIGKIRQVHNVHSRTSFSNPITNYIEVFSNNILEIIDINFNTVIDEDQLLSVFDMIESVGKKRRNNISAYISEITKETNGRVNAWTLFLAITFFSTIEKNINIKILLEDIAEKVLIIPVGIQKVLDTLNKDGE